jgi:hypothetical protein
MGNLPTPVKPSADHLLDAPLEDLLSEFGIELNVYAIDEPEFTGIAVVKAGRIRFILPAGRPSAEHDMMARAMLGRTLHVELPDLPAPYQLSELTEDGQSALVNPRRVRAA